MVHAFAASGLVLARSISYRSSWCIVIACLCLAGCGGGRSAPGSAELQKEAPPSGADVQAWKPLANGLWTNGAGELAFRISAIKESGEDVSRYQTEIANKKLKDVIDQETFHALGQTFFYRDRSTIFLLSSMAGGGTLDVLAEADPDTFQVIGCYARDKNAIYTDHGRTVPDADLDSFYTTEEAGCYARDRNGYFSREDRVASVDALDEPGRESIRKLGPIQQ